MVHLALEQFIALCVQIFLVTSAAAAKNWNILICIHACVCTYVFETGCKDKMLFQSK